MPDIRAVATAASQPSLPSGPLCLPALLSHRHPPGMLLAPLAQGCSAQAAPAPIVPSTPLHLTGHVLIGIYTLSLDPTKLPWGGDLKKIKPHHNTAVYF